MNKFVKLRSPQQQQIDDDEEKEMMQIWGANQYWNVETYPLKTNEQTNIESMIYITFAVQHIHPDWRPHANIFISTIGF